VGNVLYNHRVGGHSSNHPRRGVSACRGGCVGRQASSIASWVGWLGSMVTAFFCMRKDGASVQHVCRLMLIEAELKRSLAHH